MKTRAVLALLAAVAGGCAVVPASGGNSAEPMEQVAAAGAPAPPADVEPNVPRTVFSGELTQGGWLRGQVPAGTVAARLGDVPLTLDAEGQFFGGIDRDAGPQTTLAVTLANGATITELINISPRAWQIERVNAPLRPGGSSPAAQARRAEELAEISAARAIASGAQGWRESFIWPASGRISGRFGSQRIYQGEPGSYHTGLDIAGGSGAPVVAPASGVVVLAADRLFSLEGNLLIVDHGQGLNSAFLHLSEILVAEGDRVEQGQLIGRIGATGRASGPHLHWGLKWGDARLDPLLFLPPRP